MRNILTKGVLLLFVCVPKTTIAQEKDSTAIVKEFMEVCNNYKQLPLQLDMEFRRTSNFISTYEDTTYSNASFYITPTQSYMKFSELEEIVSDSVALIVSSKRKRIVVIKNTQPVLVQMKKMISMPLSDSIIAIWNNKFSATKSRVSADENSINLSSHALISGSSFPKEQIEIRYKGKTKEPVHVTTISRQLLSIDSVNYIRLLHKPDMEGKVFYTIKDGYYIVMEQTTVCTYKQIRHGIGIKIPVDISERVIKNGQGKYLPVKEYSNYKVTGGF